MSQSKGIAPPQKKEDGPRGAAPTALRSNDNIQNVSESGSSAMNGKGAATASNALPFGAAADEVVTLEPDAAKSKGPKDAAPAIEVVDDAKHEAVQYNELSTKLVLGMDSKAVLEALSTALHSYSQEIEFSVNWESMEITNGVVIVNNYHAVHFKVYLVDAAQADGDGVRVEFRRNSGNALAAASFLGEINGALDAVAVPKRPSTGNLFVDAVVAATVEAVRDSMSNHSLDAVATETEADGADEAAADSAIALDTDFDGLELKMNEEQKEQMMVHEALIADANKSVDVLNADESVGDIPWNAEKYLLRKLEQQGAISNEEVDHDALFRTLMAPQTLCHRDITVVRAAFLVLRNLVQTHSEKMARGESLAVVLAAMEGAEYRLSSKYAVYFLSALSAVKGQWALDESLAAKFKAAVQSVEAECGGVAHRGKGDGIDFGAIAFEAIYEAL